MTSAWELARAEASVAQEKCQGRRGDDIDEQRLNFYDSKGRSVRAGGPKVSLVSVVRGGGTE